MYRAFPVFVRRAKTRVPLASLGWFATIKTKKGHLAGGGEGVWFRLVRVLSSGMLPQHSHTTMRVFGMSLLPYPSIHTLARTNLDVETCVPKLLQVTGAHGVGLSGALCSV